MNAGNLTINWLYRDSLRVDDQWSVRHSKGFTWWANRHAQRIDVIGSEPAQDGGMAHLVRVKTDLVRDVTLGPRALGKLDLLMATATMAGPVYDPDAKTVSLSSLVKVHEPIREWMQRLLSVAAMLQVTEAELLGPAIAERLGGTSAESGHPKNGLRPVPDELTVGFPLLLGRRAEQPSAWTAKEFQQAAGQYMQQPPALLATSGGQGLAVEFPYGAESSLCQMKGDQVHPRIGNGLFLLQSFPVKKLSKLAGSRLALELNAQELEQNPSGYGFGSYLYQDATIGFVGFVPNLAHHQGLLPSLFYACASRARAMAMRFVDDDWSEAWSDNAARKPLTAMERLLKRRPRRARPNQGRSGPRQPAPRARMKYE